MFGRYPIITQENIITNYNIFVDGLQEKEVDAKLNKMSSTGVCNGLTYCYKIYGHEGRREEYIHILRFINELKSKYEIHSLIEKYKEAKAQNKTLMIQLKDYRISFDKIISMLEGIYYSQKDQTFLQIGVIWDKNYSFICEKGELASYFEKLAMKEGESAFMSLGDHIFYVEKTKEGFYLFEPNNISDSAVNPSILKNVKQLSNEIILNINPLIRENNLVAFKMQFISYAKKSNKRLEKAIFRFEAVEEGIDSDNLTNYPQIERIIQCFYKKKISRLDCALVIQERIEEIQKARSMSLKLQQFKSDIDSYIESQNFFILNQLDFNPNHINESAYESCYSLPYFAVKNNQIYLLKQLINSGVNVNINTKRKPLLYFAVLDNHIEIVELLLANKDIQLNAEVDFKISEKATTISILGLAVITKFYPIVKLLINHPKMQINLPNVFGEAAIFRVRDIRIASLLIEHPNFDFNVKDNTGMPLVHHFRAKDKQILEIILKKQQALVNEKYLDGTPLYFAVYDEDPYGLKLLLSHPEIDVNLATQGGVTPLHMAAKYGNVELVDLLLKHPAIEINLIDNEGKMPLHTAVINNFPDVVSLFLKQRDLNINRQYLDMTSLYISVLKKLNSVTELLLNHPNIDVNLPDEEGNTPLHIAAIEKNIDIVPLLLKKHTIDVNLPDNDGDTPLHAAIHASTIGIITQLINHPEIDINALNNNGRSPLFLAASLNRPDIVKLLVNHPKIKVDILSKKGHTPLFIAALDGFEEVVTELLKSPDIDINIKNDGLTSLSIAKKQGHYKIVELLQDFKKPDESFTFKI
ncbi:MAG: ankyrin repeat domain-containing protein [Tatlockia sp.]|nr:ankyrin repeat domain-containing protein [Tatlockia sp.]